MHFTPLGDRAATITFGDTIDEATHQRVRLAALRISRARPRGLIDIVPAFASIAVHYDPELVGSRQPYDAIVATLTALVESGSHEALPPPRTIEIPVCYGGELGPDLDDVAHTHAMTTDDVVRAHTAGQYMVYMVGFMPGFAYLGGLAPELSTPRRSSPRTAVPEGAVGIGGQQTGVYPMVSPGGWNPIGRTPRKIFDASRDEPSIMAAGDRVRFRAMTRDEFDAWRE